MLTQVPPVERVAMISVHTSPLAQPGAGDGGGLNVYVLETARRLAARGVAVDVFTRASAPDAPPRVTVADGLDVHHVAAGTRAPVAKEELPGLLSAFLLGMERHVERHLPDLLPDVVHAHYWLSGWVGRRLRDRWGVPFVQSFHTLARVKNDARPPGEEPEPIQRVVGESRLVEEADHIVVSVCGEARLLHEVHGTSGARLSVVPPGVDHDVFRPGAAEAPPIAPPGDGPLLLFVGRLQPLKGPDVAIETLARVRRTVPDARLLVVGGTSGRGEGRTGPAELGELARKLGVGDAVAVVGPLPQRHLGDLYRAASVVLVPSRTESFGLVALEAQACGTPVVAADVGGLRSVVEGGVLVPGHDPGDHAAAVVSLLTDDERRARAVERGLRRADGASWDDTVDQLIDVYAETSQRAAQAVRQLGA